MQVPKNAGNMDGITAQELERNRAYWERRSPIYRRQATQQAVKGTIERKSTLSSDERLREISLQEQQRRWFQKVQQHWIDMRMKTAEAYVEKIKVGTIVDVLCRVCGVSKPQMLGTMRDKYMVLHRAAICVIAREQGHSFPQIGRVIGRDHSSVVHLVKRYGGKMEVLKIVERVKPHLTGEDK